MTRFCNGFSFFVLDSILGRSPSPLAPNRRLTVHIGDPGETGFDFDETSFIFGTSFLTPISFNFDPTATYDSANDRFFISNTQTIESNEQAIGSGTITWITIWDDSSSPIPIVRVPLSSPLSFASNDKLELFPGQLLVSVRNTGQEVADEILQCVWTKVSFTLTLGNFQLGLFSFISGVNTSNEITGNTPGLSRINIDKSKFVTNTIPRYAYSSNATWGASSTNGSSNAVALLDNTNRLISYQQFSFSWSANTPIGIQANNFFLGVD